jgi:predicted nucleic acid-binding protein
MRYLQKGAGFERVRELFRTALRGDVRLMMSIVNWGEVVYSLARRTGLERASDALKSLAGWIELVDATEEEAHAAAVLKLHYKLGFADCYAAELAIRTGATVVTADPEFARLSRKIKILTLPHHQA